MRGIDPQDPEAILRLLRKGHWFAGLASPLQELVVRRSTARRYARGEWLIREGGPARGLIAILNGRVRVLRRAGSEHEVLAHIGGPGLWTGDFATFSGLPTVSSTVADTVVDALVLPPAEFERLVEEQPRRFRAFAGLSFLRYQQVYQALTDSLALPSEAWLHRKLSDIVAMRRFDDGAADATVIEASQADLATMVGVTRPTLRSLLSRLEARGLVEVGFRRVRLRREA